MTDMERIYSKSGTRLVVEGKVNGKQAFFLVDTGASVGLMDYAQRKEYKIEAGNRYHGTLVGAGGELRNVRVSGTFADVGGRTIPQFLLADISHVVNSIRRETGLEILGIISLPQMKMAGMQIDANDNLIIIE